MTYKQKLYELAAKLNCIVHDEDKEVNVEAPEGMIFAYEGIHELVNSPWDLETKATMYKQAYERLELEILEKEKP